MDSDSAMELRLNREIKAFCPDFAPIRRLLGESGAVFIEVKEQIDFFYNLPNATGTSGTRRLKLRVEDEKPQIIYYYDRQENGARTSRYQLWEVGDAQVRDILDSALGVRAVVRKSREQLRKDNAIFNLDTVEGVGQIFEVEVQAEGVKDIDAQVDEYRRIFSPYLGQTINGSNEDLVPEMDPH